MKAQQSSLETLSLSLAFLRADAMRAILVTELKPFESKSGTGERADVKDGLLRAIRDVTANPSARMWTSMWFFYAATYVVVEGWRSGGFVDPAIDALLQSSHVETLRRFRNAIWHPNPIDDQRVAYLMDLHGDVAPWLHELMAEFKRFLKALHTGPVNEDLNWIPKPSAPAI